MIRFRILAVAIVSLLTTILFAQDVKTSHSAISGQWDAVITNASKLEVPFTLAVMQDKSAQGRFRAAIANGSERMPFTSAAWEGHEFQMRLEQYDGTLTVHFEGEGLRGEWVRQTSRGVMHYAVRASRHKAQQERAGEWTGASLAGQWTLTFEGPENPDKVSPADFKQGKARVSEGGVDAAVEGTIAPVSGDYGLLAGNVRESEGKPTTFQLSRFDGIHAVLVTGELLADGSIKGKLNTQGFTGVRRNAVAGASSIETEPDPESVTTLKQPGDVFKFSARDPKTGKLVTQDDPRFKGKPYIVDIFGTWCPNCHDEAPLLADLYKRYRGEGLEIVGLAYEYVDDAARNAKLLDVYRKKYGIEFPLLLAGTTEEGQIGKTLPQLVGFGAYPTTIFVGRDGKVKKIHAGFAGPATGERFTETKRRFDENVKALVAK